MPFQTHAHAGPDRPREHAAGQDDSAFCKLCFILLGNSVINLSVLEIPILRLAWSLGGTGGARHEKTRPIFFIFLRPIFC